VADAEIEAIHAQLAAHPRPAANLAERRKRLDALGTQYALPPDVSVEPVTANGVPAGWTTTPGANSAPNTNKIGLRCRPTASS
jgi:epsilon-lactone hydrolase